MNIIIFFIALVFFEQGYANCELASRRFHTIATYGFIDGTGLQASSSFVRDGGLLFSSDLRARIKGDNYLEKVNEKFGVIKTQSSSISLEGAKIESFSSVRGELTYLKTKEFIKTDLSEPIAILDSKKRTISLSGERYFPGGAVKKTTEPLPGNLASILKSTLASEDFTLVKEITDYKNGSSDGWLSQKLGDGSWELVQVKTKFLLPEEIDWKGRWGNEDTGTKVKAILGWLAFLTRNGKDFWYVGNSSGDPCGSEVQYELSSSIQDGIGSIGFPLPLYYGLRYKDESGDKLIYSLGDRNILYYLDFGKDMIVISNNGYR